MTYDQKVGTATSAVVRSVECVQVAQDFENPTEYVMLCRVVDANYLCAALDNHDCEQQGFCSCDDECTAQCEPGASVIATYDGVAVVRPGCTQSLFGYARQLKAAGVDVYQQGVHYMGI